MPFRHQLYRDNSGLSPKALYSGGPLRPDPVQLLLPLPVSQSDRRRLYRRSGWKDERPSAMLAVCGSHDVVSFGEDRTDSAPLRSP